jgi:hypothetical protein
MKLKLTTKQKKKYKGSSQQPIMFVTRPSFHWLIQVFLALMIPIILQDSLSSGLKFLGCVLTGGQSQWEFHLIFI